MAAPPESGFTYAGDTDLRPAVEKALARVIDPEMSLDIVALGLVYGIEATRERVRIDLTMTSAACPVTEMICDDVARELQSALGTQAKIEIAVVWEPPWTPERMSASARAAMGWE